MKESNYKSYDELLLFAWDDFFERFHEIYPPEKRVEIEAACQASNESE